MSRCFQGEGSPGFDLRISPLRVPEHGTMLPSWLESCLGQSSLDGRLRTLVALRAAQMTQCPETVTHYAQAAEHYGVRPDAVARWYDDERFDARDGAALAWAEVVTAVTRGPRWEGALELVRRYFADHEIYDLTIAIGEANLRARMALAVRPPRF